MSIRDQEAHERAMRAIDQGMVPRLQDISPALRYCRQWNPKDAWPIIAAEAQIVDRSVQRA